MLIAVVLCWVFGLTSTANAGSFVYEKDSSPQVSPNGWNLWNTDEAFGQQELMPYFGVNPALDPAGTRVAYATPNGYFVSRIDGSSTTQISPASPGCVNLRQAQPQWTPDGQGVLTDANCDIQLSLDIGTWQSEYVINWPGRQMAPTMSPDGSDVAFLSNTDPWGNLVSPGNPDDYAIFAASPHSREPLNDRGFFQVTSPNRNDPNSVFPQTVSFSPDGTSIAFEGYDNNNTGGSDSEIYITRVGTGTVTQVTNDDSQEWGADWLADGRIAFAAGDQSQTSGQFHAINPDGTGETDLSPPFNDGYHIGSISGRQPAGPGGVANSWADVLLLQYAPELHYDAQETFFADSPAEMTDFAGYAGQPPNDLKGEAGETIAGHGNGLPLLNLDFLGPGPTYPLLLGPPVGSSDYVDAEQTSDVGYAVAANSMRLGQTASGYGYGDNTYGRVVQKAGGRLWLQYWFFYYDNPFAPGFNTGTHEGDWEMIQIGLDPDTKAPQVAVYSQHTGAESCDWSLVPKNHPIFGPDHEIPISYVGAGSHANFFFAGSTGQEALGLPLPSVNPITKSDQHNGNLITAWPNMTDVTHPPGWVEWPGHWGSTKKESIGGLITLPTGESPQGPKFHSQWDDPDGYARDAGDCPISASSGTAQTATTTSAVPAAPTALSATLQDGQAAINYTLANAALPSADRRILLTISGTGPQDTPIGGMFDASQITGSRRLPLPLASAPYLVSASVFTQKGLRSPIVSAAVGAASP